VPEHGGHSDLDATTLFAVLVAVPAVWAYLRAVRRSSGRRPWPWSLTWCWLAGTLAVLLGSAGPLAAAAHADSRAHAAAHVLVGMLGPLLLCLGAPVTLALRTLPVAAGRRVTALLRRRPLRVLTEPSVAVLLNVGGLWLLYTTPLLRLAYENAALHLLVHVHLVLAGYLLAAVLVGRDPLPHRRSHLHRAAVLVAALAGHGMLAKLLYAAPPAGIDPATAQAGAMVMYYGGDAVDLALAVLVCVRWYRSGQRQLDLERPRARPQGVLG